MKSIRMPVQDALQDYGSFPDAAATALSQLGKLRLPQTFILALRNNFRDIRRQAITVLAMSLGVAIFNTGFNVRQSLWEMLLGLKQELRYDVQVVLNKPVPVSQALKPFQGIKNIRAVEAWMGGQGEIQSRIISTDNGTGVIALPTYSDLVKLKLSTGRWLKQASEVEVVLNQQALKLYHNPGIGDYITLAVGPKRRKARLVGIAEQLEKPKLFIDVEQFHAAFNPSGTINTLSFVCGGNSEEQVVKLKKDIEQQIAASDLHVLFVMSESERVSIVYKHLNIILTVIVLLSFLVLLVSATGIASATGINIRERTREIGILRAIGATAGQIYSLFIYEGMITSIISLHLGLLLSYPLSLLAGRIFGNLMLGEQTMLRYAFSWAGFSATVLICLFFAWLATALPSRYATHINTRKALNYE